MKIDKTHKLDVTSRLNPNQARKWLTEALHSSGTRIVRITAHCFEEMQEDSLTEFEIYGVLKHGRIYNYPELEKGTYRYRVETSKIVVIVAFHEPNWVRCVTAWRKL